ncbi:MAG: hypothetical protein CL932_23855, partial [Deltaproteobacteria bacterium]|nr:hypothetical protein [Deltaproteobacteria bacterium]
MEIKHTYITPYFSQELIMHTKCRQPSPWSLVICALFVASVLLPSTVMGKTKQWTSQADWSAGTGNNFDAKKTPGALQIFYDPAKQQYNETRFIYIPSSGLNTVAKMDTKTGQILWVYNLTPLGKGSNPSRTTVDTRGNVWVGLRNGNDVVAITQDGKFVTSVTVGGGPRAVTVDKNGDIWAGAYATGKVVKISGATYKPILTITDANLRSYGATTDSYGNIWISNRPFGNVVKIDVAQGKIVGRYSAPNVYGIAADRRGYVWAASYANSQVFQFDARNGNRVKTFNVGARARGVAVDGKNKVWVACSNTSAGANTKHVAWVDPFTGTVKTFNNVGTHTIGIAVDSKGFVWANSLSEGFAYKLNSTTGAYVAKYPVCDTTGTKTCYCNNGVKCTGCKCASAGASSPYTYSDMTGFQLQVIVAPSKATWRVTYDAQCKASFSKVNWNGSLPAGTKVTVRARSASTKAGLSSAAWKSYVNKGQALGVASNRFIELEFLMETQDSRTSPTVTDATLTFGHFPEICDGIDNNCDGSVDETYTDLGNTCSLGKGICKRNGKKVCNSAKNGTVCDAKPGTPQKEVCDNKDNDCDGQVDEDWDKKGQSCSVGVGACNRKGQWVCKNTNVVCSVVAGTPSAEVCDNKDNDCNGQVDDNLRKVCSSKCGQGQQSCQNGQWSACNAQQPKAETCNDADDDCDGQVDEGITRPCSTICGTGTEQCKRGKFVFCDA